MLLPCEVAVKTLIPTLKALVAKEMVIVHGLRQEQVAALLGTTQPAISQYLSGIRGRSLKLEKNKRTMTIVGNMVTMLMKPNVSQQDLMTEFCKACIIVRKEGLLCDLHRHLEPQLGARECQLCSAVSDCRAS